MSFLATALAFAVSVPVPCYDGHVSCNSTFGMNHTGCCALDDAEAVCCQTPLPTGLVRSYCCPKGASCSTHGCTPRPSPTSLCGPTQGDNCNVSYLCSSGPEDWTKNRANALPAVLVMGDSVSNGWTPVLAHMLAATHVVVHSPGLMADGGARSTSNLVNCAGYLLTTAELKPLPLATGDHMLMNFGLHDYNLGLAGVAEYTAEYRTGLTKAKAITDAAGATLTMLGTTPAHNTRDANGTRVDDETVRALNKAAAALASEFGVQFVDLHTPLVSRCGEVPWADDGASACNLCAPQCAGLSVHYTAAGYEVIAGLIANATGLSSPTALFR